MEVAPSPKTHHLLSNKRARLLELTHYSGDGVFLLSSKGNSFNKRLLSLACFTHSFHLHHQTGICAFGSQIRKVRLNHLPDIVQDGTGWNRI